MLYLHVDPENVLKAIKAFVRELRRCPGVVVTRADIRPRVPHAELLPYLNQTPRYPYELLYLYRHADGLDIEWEFADGQPGGRLCVPPFAPGRYLQADSRAWPADGYGKPAPEPGSCLSCLVDDLGAEAGTWLVSSSSYVRRHSFLYRDQQAGVVLVDGSMGMADYLLLALAYGFAPGWPWAAAGGASPEVASVLTRLQQNPPEAGWLQPGRRVSHSSTERNSFRGEVLEVWPASSPAPTFARVRFDLGETHWVTGMRLKLLPPVPDLYEQYRRDPWALLRLGETAGWELAARQMALLWSRGDGGSYNGYSPGSPTLLGLLPLPLPQAVAWAQGIADGLLAAEFGSDEGPLPLPEAERKLAYEPALWRGGEWHYYWTSLLLPLLTALAGRIRQAPAAEREQVTLADLDQLEATANAFYRNTRYWTGQRLKEFSWLRAALLGKPLPDDAPGQQYHLASNTADLPALARAVRYLP